MFTSYLDLCERRTKFRSFYPNSILVFGTIGRSRWPRGLRRKPMTARLLLLGFEIPPGAMDVGLMWVWCVPGRGLWVGLITHSEESYRLWCVQWVWSRSPLRGGYDTESGCSAKRGDKVFSEDRLSKVVHKLLWCWQMYQNSSFFVTVTPVYIIFLGVRFIVSSDHTQTHHTL
jgi:hypothetical protein